MFRILSLCTVIAAFFPVCLALAEDPPKPSGPDPSATFGQLDANQDGQLTSGEIPEDQRRLFERLLRTSDKNKDSKLNAEEFAAGLQPAAERRDSPDASKRPDERRPEGRPAPGKLFERFDTNGDGKLALDEVPQPRKERFKEWVKRGDKDSDGALDRAEFRQALADPTGPNGRPEDVRRGDAKQFFSRLDQNADGKLTPDDVPEERRTFVERLVRRGDKDGDQALSLEEFEAARPERPGQGPPGADNPRRPPPDRVGPPAAGLFAALDADHDGRLASGEIAAAPEALRKLDKDGDGAVSFAEIMALAPRDK